MQPPTNNRYTNKPKASRFLPTLTLFGLLAIIGAMYINHQSIFDWWHLRNYTPPNNIVALADLSTMKPYTRKVFYVNHPLQQSKKDFRASCPNNGGEQTIVLGCYHGMQNGVFLLKVTDSRLQGVEEVTAAHETLHAIYDRLSPKDRTKVNAMLQDYYDHDLHDGRIRDTIAAYKKSEPNDVVNEMHSIFGTEVLSLPAGLENYYAKYFSNRRQIAEAAAEYQAEFTNRQAAVKQDDAQLADMKAEIDSDQADLKSKQTAISSQQETLLSLRSSNVSAYNAAVPGYNKLVEDYNTEVQSLQTLVGQYNQLVAERNAIAVEETQLANDLNANIVPKQK